MPAMQQPEAYLAKADKMFTGDDLTDEHSRPFLQKFVDSFAAWIERHAD
jgi:chromate reductase